MSTRVALMLQDALKAHDIVSTIVDDIVSLAGCDVGFRGLYAVKSASDGGISLQLDIAAAGPILEGRAIWDSFGGFGDSEDKALADAFGKFLLGPFHVLLNVLADHHCDNDGTEWSLWKGDAGCWRVCDSPVLAQGGDPHALACAPFFGLLKAGFGNTAAPGLHWASVFFAFLNGEKSGFDIRLDGVAWPEGERAWETSSFEVPMGYVSVRYFFIAVPQ